MPGQISITRAKGQPATSPDVDFAMCIIGAASAGDVGEVSPPYSSPSALAEDYGIGDGVDAAMQAVTKTDGNPSPPAVNFVRTPATTPGSIGTIDHSLVVGTAVPTAASTAAPLGTYQVRVRVPDDGNDGGGTAIGTAGIILQASVDDGRTWFPTEALGTSTRFTVKIPGASPISTGAIFDLLPSSSELTALYTKLNTFKTTVAAHFTITTGSPQVHASADTTNNTALTAVSNATTPATAVTLFNAIKTYLDAHGQDDTAHSGKDNTLHTALAAIATAVNVTDVDLKLNALITAYNAHRQNTTSVHGSADGTNTITAFSASPPTLITDDEWSAPTSPPMWSVGDLYTAGPPATGALAAIAESSYNFSLIVITEPVASGDFATLVAGIDAMTALAPAKRPTVIIRFRDPNQGESDSDYITAARAWRAAIGAGDERFVCVAGSGWLTDAFRAYVYLRSGLPALLARLQSMSVIAGSQGERVAQHPGYGARGPLEGFSLVDGNGNLVGHDEFVRGGLDGPIASTGGFLTFCYQRHDAVRGTYVSEAPCLYPVLSNVVTLMDNRVSSGIERELYAVAWTNIQGADVVDPTTLTLDDDIRDAMASQASAAIRAKYAREIQNADDANLVTVDPTVTVDGSKVTTRWNVNDRLFLYTDGVDITVNNSR